MWGTNKSFLLYQANVGIKNQEREKYGTSQIWRTSHILPHFLLTTHFQAHPWCLALSSPVAVVGGCICAILHAESMASLLPQESACRRRVGWVGIPRRNCVIAPPISQSGRCRGLMKSIPCIRRPNMTDSSHYSYQIVIMFTLDHIYLWSKLLQFESKHKCGQYLN